MDIVERLRDETSMYDADDVDLHLDAVDEIERLRETIETLINTTHITQMTGLAVTQVYITGGE